MKNLHKITLSVAVIAACLSSGVFAMDQFEAERATRGCAGTSSGQSRQQATTSASLKDDYTVPQIGDQPYEEWLNGRIAYFASSELFLGIPQEDREDLLQKSLIEAQIPRWQEEPKIFYTPGMERDQRYNQVKCLNAELAILAFEQRAIAYLVKTGTRDHNSRLSKLAEHTENTYKARAGRVGNAGQRIVDEIVKDLKDTPEEIQKRDRVSQLRSKWRHQLSQNEGQLIGLPAVIEVRGTVNITYNLTKPIIAAEYCRPRLFQNREWLQDLRMNAYFHVLNDNTIDDETRGKRLNYYAVAIYNELAEEQILKELEAAEKARIEDRGRAAAAEFARLREEQETREKAAREKEVRRKERQEADQIRAAAAAARAPVTKSSSQSASDSSVGKKGRKK